MRIHSNLLAFHYLGHRITMVTYANGSEIDLPDVTIHRTPHLFRMRNPQKVGPSIEKLFSDLSILSISSRILSQEQYDIILATDIEGAVIAARLKIRFRLPVIIDIHGIFTELLQVNTPRLHSLLGNIPRWIEKKAWQKADLLVCNCQRVERYAKFLTPDIPSCTIFDVPQPSVHEVAGKPYPATVAGRKWQQHLFNKKVVFYAGNFAPYQNFSLALNGLRYAIDCGLSDVVLLTVGSDYGPYLREAMDLGIKKNVLFIGKKTPEETIDLMRLADICLTLIACGGNTPSKILNYFLAGRPILACDSPAHKEFLSDGNNAIFCNNDPIDFAKKLIYLLKNNDVRQRLAHASSEYARNFTIDAFRNKWKNILKNFEK